MVMMTNLINNDDDYADDNLVAKTLTYNREIRVQYLVTLSFFPNQLQIKFV